MASQIQGSQIRLIELGIKVDRAAALLPQTATGSLFAISGGRIILTSIVGEVTVALGATATNAKLVSTPTTGTAKDICAVLAEASLEVGTLLGITGVFTDAMTGSNAGAANIPTKAGVVLPIGNLGLSTSANDTGQIKWSLTYIPLDDGASVAAV